MKNGAFAAAGTVGGAVSFLFGGWDDALTALVIFMSIDYITGLIVAAVFKNSPKTENGALHSHESFLGLCRKGVTLLIVLVASQLDMITGSGFIKDAVVIAFITSETISIVENAGLMGIPVPDKLTKAIELLKKTQSVQEPMDVEIRDEHH